MTAIATTARRQLRISAYPWIVALLVMAVAGLTAALIVSLTSSDSTAPARSTNGNTPTTTSQVGGSSNVVQGQLTRCPGSVKDFSC
jgi:hypothetical protein